MADTLRVRMYNVRFGDAILVTVPDNGVRRHILIDVGNRLFGEGGADDVFKPVVEDILAELDGQPLDLYIMTHEHMDHVQGLQYADDKVFPDESLVSKLQVQHAWFPASSEPDYYETHPKAKKKKAEARAAYAAVERFLQAAPIAQQRWAETLMAINNWQSTQGNVEYLRGLAQHTWYVYRGVELAGKHSFQEAQFEIMAPEEDTSIYYPAFRPVALMGSYGQMDNGLRQDPDLAPPPGVDESEFFDLLELRGQGYARNLRAIDRAENNTSVVFCLSWRGYRLLFSGDAEDKSWQYMNKFLQLSPVDFYKVSHHASSNGMPPVDILDKILPRGDGLRYAAVSTFPALGAPAEDFVYPNIPSEGVLTELAQRSQLRTVLEVADGAHVDIEFEAA